MKTSTIHKIIPILVGLFAFLTLNANPDYSTTDNFFDYCRMVRAAMTTAHRNAMAQNKTDDIKELQNFNTLQFLCERLNGIEREYSRQMTQNSTQEILDIGGNFIREDNPKANFEIIDSEKYSPLLVKAMLSRRINGIFPDDEHLVYLIDNIIKERQKIKDSNFDPDTVIKYSGSEDVEKAIREALEFLWKYRTGNSRD